MKISFFKKGIKNTIPEKHSTIKDAHDYIKSESARETTNTLRAIQSSDDAIDYKARCFRCVTFSGTFTKRKVENLLTFSGYICVDIDDVSNATIVKQTLCRDESMQPVLAFISPSGNGVKAVYRVSPDLDPAHVSEAYSFLADKIENKNGFVVDQTPKSVATACFLPWDQDSYFNKDAPEIELPSFRKSTATESGINSYPVNSQTVEKIEELVKHLQKNNINIADNYKDWIDLGFALASLGEDGRPLYHQVSKISSKYNYSDCEEQFNICLRDGRGDITIGTFFHMLKKADVASGEVLNKFNTSLTIIPSNPDGFWTQRQNDRHKARRDQLIQQKQHFLVKWINEKYGVDHLTLCEYYVGLGQHVFDSGSIEDALFVPYEHGIRAYYVEGDTLKYDDLKTSVPVDSFFGIKHVANKKKAYVADNPFDAMRLSSETEFDVIAPLMQNGPILGERQAEVLKKAGKYWEQVYIIQGADFGNDERNKRSCFRSYADVLGTETEIYWINPVKLSFSKQITVQELFFKCMSDNIDPLNEAEYVWNNWTEKCRFWFTTDSKKPKIEIDEVKLSRVLRSFGFVKHYFGNAEEPILLKSSDNVICEVSSHRLNDFVRDEILERLSKFVDVSTAKNGNKLMSRRDLFRTFNKYREKVLNVNIKAIFKNEHIKLLKENSYTSYLFFQNTAVKITKDCVELVPYKSLPGKIWDSQVLERPFNDNSADSVKGDFETFVENVSGSTKRNKKAFMSAFGYLLHTYKDKANARAVILVDENSTPGFAQGGTGKSLFAYSLKHLRSRRYIAGKTVKTNSQFLFMDAKLGDQILLFDDVKEDFDFESLFNVITDDMQVEAKYRNRLTIPFEDSPKIVVATNNIIHGFGNSFTRRQYVLPFNNYYINNPKPDKEFGHKLFEQWDDREWNRFDKFAIRCLQEYLKNGLTFTQTNNFRIRSFKEKTSDSFYDWAESNLEKGLEYKANVLFNGIDKTATPSTNVSPINNENNTFPTFCEVSDELTDKEFRSFMGWLRQFAEFKKWKINERLSNGYTVIRYT